MKIDVYDVNRCVQPISIKQAMHRHDHGVTSEMASVTLHNILKVYIQNLNMSLGKNMFLRNMVYLSRSRAVG